MILGDNCSHCTLVCPKLEFLTDDVLKNKPETSFIGQGDEDFDLVRFKLVLFFKSQTSYSNFKM